MAIRKQISGREKESRLLKQADQAVAVVRLLGGYIQSWEEFLEPSTKVYSNLPRKQLKAAKKDIAKRLKKEIKLFCKKNFQGITEKNLLILYEDIKATRGLELPLNVFEAKYGKVNPDVIKGSPAHLTVCISLWGMQFLFPEDLLSKDIIVALDILQESEIELGKFRKTSHQQLSINRAKVKKGVREKEFAKRSIILSCFNLMEAFLNGIAWDYYQKNDVSKLSRRKRELLSDTSSASTRNKLLKYPGIVSNSEVAFSSDPQKELFLEIIKPYRDSLVHPSPFSAPEKFGGYDKLKMFYELNVNDSIQAVETLCEIIETVCEQIYGADKQVAWLEELKARVSKFPKQNNR